MRALPMKCELLEIEGAFNVRDLGGYAGARGQTRTRRFIRAGSMSSLTGKGRAQLEALGTRCIVDLRSSIEATRMPDTVSGTEMILYRQIPMMDYIQSSITSGDFTSFPKSMTELYMGILDNSQREIREVFALLADPAYATVLFHCTAGKDRTGIVAMLLLLLAGVSEEDTVEDYCWSDKLIGPMDKSGDLPHYLFESRSQTMWDTIGHLREAYGGAEAYLDKVGVALQQRSLILDKFFC